jgi:[protein-PII] uridylyltransferase
MMSEVRELRSTVARRRAEIAAAHREGASGFDVCRALTAAMDDAVRKAFAVASAAEAPGGAPSAAIVALGGYGRVELCPASDVDVMVLCPDDAPAQVVDRFAASFLHVLWDAGMDVGHSVRHLRDIRDMRGRTTSDIWSSLLESRLVCGDEALATRLQALIAPDPAAGPDRWFLRQLLEEAASRHARYGHSVKLLEPDLKRSAGGLRDFHSVLWLTRSSAPAMSAAWDDRTPAATFLLRHLTVTGAMGQSEAEAIGEALDFLLRARQEMHLLRHAPHDMLEYSLQRDVAAGLGFGPAAEASSAEAFMRAYYRHAHAIHRLHVRMLSPVRDLLDPRRPAHEEGEQLGSLFALHEDRLTVDPAMERFDRAADIFEAFAHAAEADVLPDVRLARLIEQGTGLFGDRERASPVLAGWFRRILRSEAVGATLRSMNDVGILGAYIPEFGELVAFFQHSVYHYYTADEHTLIALANAELLRTREGLLHDVFQRLRRKDILYLAILLHDIGKPRGVADHEHTGETITGTVLHRLGMDADIPAVAFLVRHHLVMEQTAFRRNIHDPDTLRDFAARFPSQELLDMLYLLTYADLSAVNSSVWTGWKASLLQELYLRSSALVRGEADDADAGQREERIRLLEQHLHGAVGPGEIRRHLDGIPNGAYMALFADAEIAVHIRMGKGDGAVTTLVADREGYSEVTVIARDAPFLLSRCCAVLSANDANIFDATVMTRDDGVIFDRFRVTAVRTGRHLERAAHTKIAEDMSAVLAGTLDIERLFQAHRRRWRRVARPARLPGKDDVRLEEAGAYTIIDVYAADSVGLLYRLTDAMSRLGLDIHFAKIATRGDGVADAFYVRDHRGQPLDIRGDAGRTPHTLRDVLAALANEELA